MSKTKLDPGEAVTILARTPRVLDAWLRDLDDGWLDTTDGTDTWSPRQVVAHLIHGEHDDWIPRLRRILNHGTARPFDPFNRGASIAGADRPIDELLDDFATSRAQSLVALDAVLEAGLDLDARGVHPELGEVSARQLLATWTAHDLGHMVQISRTMARRYAGAVGPWARYLSVMEGVPGADRSGP